MRTKSAYFANSSAGVVSLPCGMMILTPIGVKIIIPQGERLKVRLPDFVGAAKMVKFGNISEVLGTKTAYLRESAYESHPCLSQPFVSTSHLL